ncbi:MAG: hypothetical protein RL235_489, partial [Chlamydiota bacterium]
LDICLGKPGHIQVKVFVKGVSAHSEEVDEFSLMLQDKSPVVISDLPELSPLRQLATAKWWGIDAFRLRHGDGLGVHRFEIEVGGRSELFELKNTDWLVWNGVCWEKMAEPCDISKAKCIAKMGTVQGKQVTFDAWDGSEHARLAVSQVQESLFKVRPEELFASIRIRSDKQISCLLEKQCLVLRAGDWVFKGDAKWRILRKPEEKKAYAEGRMVGELFVFNEVEVRGNQKLVLGQLFNAGRTQIVPIEVVIHAQKKGGRIGERIARGRLK